ncbi:carbohydrate-binding protein [Fulvivirga sp. 29W222]|uniref:Carbohydrate-binding protein n=1 Tax=Fulvivirga marina TaxID=2494733 RepID=A0A937KDX4_9BACT|nr:carbohydrate-binding protein [Fulvivirga marina]MBL6448924.1 carbohydrate-binding protein [Fulvivirga marina]
MKNLFKRTLRPFVGLISLMVLTIPMANAQVSIKEAGGWLESAYVKWTPVSNAERYNVYYTGGGFSNRKIDNPLIRSYGSYYRADVLGIPAGNYIIKVIPVISGVENSSLASTTQTLAVRSHVREGFAFTNNVVPGAYNMNGTPKSGAKIIYVTADNANTVKCEVINDKGQAVSVSGLINILGAKGKGYDKTPLIIRMIGQVKAKHVIGLKGGNSIFFIGANTTDRLIENITIEGVGDDATVYGYGFYTKRSRSIEIRNFGIMLFGDDGVAMESNNSHVWVHNNDLFYGTPGPDADQVKGDGSIDMKYNTTNITISFNHFWDTGKSTFAGGATETNTIRFTYHHNWFDHSDSRHPRLCWATTHVYNNYYDGVAGMGLLSTEASSAFVEANYYRHCPYPMMINMQGTNREIWPNGSQNGGIVKAYNNMILEARQLIYQTERPDDFDAYLVTSRDEQIPETVKSSKGSNTYSNFDTDPSMYSYKPDSPNNVPNIVKTYAGRMNGGDLKWTFDDSVDDPLHEINQPFKAMLVGYESSLVSVQEEEISPISVTGVSVLPGSMNIEVGNTVQLTAAVSPSNATNHNVEWSSSNTSVASVSSSGLVTAIAKGSATITVTTNDGGHAATSAISVCAASPLTSYVQINGGAWTQTKSASVNKGDNVTFGPQPTSGGTWSWSGPNGYSASSREIDLNNVQASQTGVYIATFTNSCGTQSSLSVNLTMVSSGFYDAFSIIQAEDYDEMSGVRTEACGEGGLNVGYIDNGEWIRFSNVDFGNGASSFDARIARNAGTISLRLDGINGEEVGVLNVASTGGSQVYETQSCDVSGVSGVHDLYLVFGGGGGFNVNWFKFVALATNITLTIQEQETGFCSVDGRIDNDNAGFSGTGFANTSNSLGNGVTWSVSIPSSGPYILRWRYANGGSAARPGDVLVDGTKVASANFEVTGTWTDWSENSSSTVAVTLPAGTHTIRLKSITSAALGNIDKMEVEGVDPQAAGCGSSSSRKAYSEDEIIREVTTGFNLYPNPVLAGSQLVVQGEDPIYLVEVYNASGGLVSSTFVDGKARVEITVPEIKGLCIIKTYSNGSVNTGKLLIN